MGASDLRVSVTVSKLRCVVEPALLLSHAQGLRLALGLANAFEVWLTRSFWRALDASELLPRRLPEPSTASGMSHLADGRALADWAALRDRTDGNAWSMRWVGDCIAESQLATPEDTDLLARFEWLGDALDSARKLAPAAPACWQALDLTASVDDTLALSAALGGAMVLCLQPSESGPPVPLPVQRLQRAGVSAQRLADDESASLLAAERLVVRQALAGAGLAVLVQSLPPLAVAHVLVDDTLSTASADEADPWATARAWWYPL